MRKRYHAILIGVLIGTLLIAPVGANDVARRDIMRVETVWEELGLYGQGQIVAVADTGLDSGNLDTLSADFADRVLETFARGRPGDWSDAHGHGTHVAGSVLGNGRLSGSDPGARNYGGSFAGVAPEASLVFQSLLDENGGLGGLPDDLGDLYRQAYDAGARIHTNSWGANFFIKPLSRFLTAGTYPPASVQTDRFAWEHKDMVIVFAAGNEGNDILPLDGVVDEDSIGAPGTAKNVITVGASESVRSSGGNSDQAWGSGSIEGALLNFDPVMEPLVSDKPSDNADGMALFSSRGPTNDGRIKPDVVAPGTNVLSLHSQHPDAVELYGLHESNARYVYCSGTSMATPLVAGATALIRQWYVETRGMPDPSAALIKATLINGAVDMSPGQYGTGETQEIPYAWPNHVTGWGRVDVAASLGVGREAEREVWFDDASEIVRTGDEVEWTRYAAGGDEPIRITLVWTDPPGEEEPEGIDLSLLTGERADPVLVNDLDLRVVAPDGREFLGNEERESGDHDRGDHDRGENGLDRLNNVEAVRIPNPVEGEYRLIVAGHEIAQGPQPFAIVMAGNRVVRGPEPTPTPPVEPGGEVESVPGASGEDDDGVGDWLAWVLIGGGAMLLAFVGVIAFVIWRRQQQPAYGPLPPKAPQQAPPQAAHHAAPHA
ncbi:MAG TPA: hypothetical protein ENN19_09425, partial [Chloroflexi bacterium]|nr:hypothetical protein [Chloroflexota bacterium]